jgi:hypothetical protein
VNTPDADLDKVVSNVRSELDSFLEIARDAGRVYEETLRRTCLELLAIEKEIASKRGETGERLVGTVGAFVEATIRRTSYDDPRAFLDQFGPGGALERKKAEMVRRVEEQEGVVALATADQMKENLERYLAKRLDPSHFLDHIRFTFSVRPPAGALKAGPLGTLSAIEPDTGSSSETKTSTEEPSERPPKGRTYD